jgi:hypothetical protein
VPAELFLAPAAALLVLGVMRAVLGFRAPQRIREIRRAAEVRGLRYSDTDPFDTLREVHLGLLHRGDEQTVQHVVWDGDDPGRARVFDLVVTDVLRDGRGREYRLHRLETCALARTPTLAAPRLLALPETSATRLATMTGTPDIEVESITVNRTYAVRCADREFAIAFLDPRVQGVLEDAEAKLALELDAGWLLVVCTEGEALAGTDVPALLAFVRDLAGSLSGAVLERYGR